MKPNLRLSMALNDLRINQIGSRKAFENPIPTRPFCLYIRALVVNVSISPAKARSQVGQSRMDHLPHNRIKGNRFRHLVPRPSVGTQVADSVLPIVLAVLMSILLLEPMLSGIRLTAPKPTLELSKHGQTSTSQLRGILLRPFTSVVTIELRHQTQSSLPCVERLCAYLSGWRSMYVHRDDASLVGLSAGRNPTSRARATDHSAPKG
jgi:hypothetical protein